MQDAVDTPQVAEIWDVPNDVYFSTNEYVSHSALEVFRRSQVEYAARFVHGTMTQPEPTPAMCLGTALHAQVLQPERWDDLVAVAPVCDRRTKEGKARWQAFVELSTGKTVIDSDQNSAVIAMAKSVCSHPEVQAIMRRAWKREQAVRCIDAAGVPRKSKIDIICNGPIIADIKTAFDPSPEGFARASANMGYHRQAAFYIDVAKIVFGKDYKFLHIVVQNCEPWEVACYCFEDSDIELGRIQNARDLVQLRECYESDEWRAPQNTGIMKIKLPRWASYVE